MLFEEQSISMYLLDQYIFQFLPMLKKLRFVSLKGKDAFKLFKKQFIWLKSLPTRAAEV